MTPDTVLRRRRAIDHIDIDGEVLLYDGLHLRLLPGAAAEVWRRVDGMTAAGTLATAIALEVPTRTDAEVAQVKRDVLAYLEDLLAHTVLELAPVGETTYSRPGHVGFVTDDTQTLLVDLTDGRRRALSSTGSRVWELTCELGAAQSVVAALRDEYADAPDTLEDEIAGLLDVLCDEGFLIRRG